MDKLKAVPIKIVSRPQNTELPNNALAILHEIEAMLEALIVSGQTASIDLHRAPLEPEDYDYLKKVLGRGEICAELDSLGPTRIQETAVSGVWWITHSNKNDKVLGEFIEVTACPEMLKSAPDDLLSGRRLLHSRLSGLASIKNPNDISKSLQALGLIPGDISRNHQSVQRGNGNAE